ncbi:(d)CMP kinase [bacterium]|nr:(d)CMP kinase [bacterium]
MEKNKKNDKFIIAIDGPASSGKSTTAKELAKRLEYVYLDTGAMYRACGLEAYRQKISLDDIPKLTKMMQNIKVEIKYSLPNNIVLLNGEDVSLAIREPHIGKLASDISAIGLVRAGMTDLQRKLGENKGIVMDGRDIGTVVFPNAEYKFFMVADLDERAHRRFLEEQEKGSTKTFAEVKDELAQRDYNDSHRDIAPLKQAEDAILIDSTHLTISEQVEKIIELIGKRK